ncbi:MAG: MCE family protein [Bacteroidetes bacterium]|nr:MAG: MCE family protein [Bacteroidota bacterium]
MSKSQNKRTVIVGLFIVLGLIFFMGGIFMIGNLHKVFNSKINVISLFEDVKGLKKGDNIWFSGVKIGTVNNISIYGPSKVEVNMNIETEVQKYIHKDTKVKISTDGLIGNKILILFGGTEKYAEVQDGDTLIVEKTLSTEEMMNTLQENNENILAITSDFKAISRKLVLGEGTIGKLLNDTSIYINIDSAVISLKSATFKTQQLVGSLTDFSSKLNKEGMLVNDLITDTVIFNSIKLSVLRLQEIADTATVFLTNLKQAGNNSKTPFGILIQDEKAGANLKVIFENLESSSKKLEENLDAMQHSFLLKGYFKKQAKYSENENKKN